MNDTNPRVIVTSATFDSEDSLRSTSSVRDRKEIAQIEVSDQSRRSSKTWSGDTRKPASWVQHAVSWATELVWCLLGIILLMALVMVLSTFNNKPLPDLPLSLTLNTIVAILATAIRAVTVFLIGQGISQAKWNQFVGIEKPLLNLHVYDEASRGPWGSLIMVLRTRGSALAVLSSFLLITSLASSTLTQSAIAYKPRLVAEPTLKAKVQYCNSYPCGDSFKEDDAVVSKFVNGLETAAFGSVFNNIDRKWPLLDPVCQSADCEWPRFDTLGVCLEMRNITDKLNVTVTLGSGGIESRQLNTVSLVNGSAVLVEQETYGGSLEQAVNITALKPETSLVAGDDANTTYPFPRTSYSFQDDPELLGTTFSQLIMIYNNPLVKFRESDSRYRAVEILLHFCVHTLDVKVKQGESKTESVQAHTQVTATQRSTVSIDGAGKAGYFEMASADGKEKFRVIDYVDFGQLDDDFGRAFSGYFTNLIGSDRQGEMTRQLGLNMYQGVVDGASTQETDTMIWNNLEKALDTTGTSMTNYMRELGVEADGTAFTSVTFVEVRWEWLTLISAQVLLSIAFLVTVVVGTARLGVDVVKSSNMAELFATSGQDSCTECKSDEGLGRTEYDLSAGISTKVGKDVRALLEKKPGGWRLEVKGPVHDP
ncbi:hypothetical protein LIA77_05203 [Sarocladium implicatum]|nr:hypothetical protein LIA77_05203 [Sarocladium implicatum]